MQNSYDLGVKTLITDCFVLRTSTILPPFAIHGAPAPFLAHVGRVNKVYLHLHASMTWRIPFDTVIIHIKKTLFQKTRLLSFTQESFEKEKSLFGDYSTVTLSSFQMSSTYCWMVLSEVNLPLHAVLSIAIFAHLSVSL